MTDRDPTPLAPSCPVCATREKVERDRGKWVCCKCWTLFTGSQDEWEKTREMRETRAAMFKALTPKADA